MSPVRAALLGGTGFVGGALARALAARGAEVRALARDPGRLALPGVETIAGDLAALPAALFAHEPEVVLHFATKQVDRDGSGFAENLRHADALCAALPGSVRLLLYGSSLSVAGQGPQRGEREEELPPRPGTALARSRLEVEEALRAAGARAGFSVVCLRPRFVLGRGDAYTLPALLRLTRRGRTLGSGRQAFSVIDVEDYAALALDLAERLRGAPPRARVLHVAYAAPLSLAEIQAALADAFGLAPPARRLRLPGWLVDLAAALPLGGLAAQAVRYQLVGQDHHVSVDALRELCGGEVVDKDPRLALAGAVAALQEAAA
ncbi:MAG: NAD-dependent epimerase/dehydratase family protein [Planctomycetota bacterium]